MTTHNDRRRGSHEMEQEDPPPFLRSWNKVYAAIIVYTIALILSLFLITAALNR